MRGDIIAEILEHTRNLAEGHRGEMMSLLLEAYLQLVTVELPEKLRIEILTMTRDSLNDRITDRPATVRTMKV